MRTLVIRQHDGAQLLHGGTRLRDGAEQHIRVVVRVLFGGRVALDMPVYAHQHPHLPQFVQFPAGAHQRQRGRETEERSACAAETTPADAHLNKRRATCGERRHARKTDGYRICVSHAQEERAGLIRLTFRLRADLGRSEGDGLDVTSFSHDEDELRRVNTVLDDTRSTKLGSASRISDASVRANTEPPQHRALPSATRAASPRRLTMILGRRPKCMRHTVVCSCSATLRW